MLTRPTILHVDINSYFATLLQQENPKLRGKPIGVVKDVGRTCLIAASKEAKTYGVKTGSRLKEAKLHCPQILPIPASFERYLDATYRLKQIFRSISPDVYIYSLDEAFIDISDCLTHLYSSPDQAAYQVRAAIKRDLGEWVTCSVGISHNRLLAKLASEVSEPDSITTIDHSTKDAFLASTPFSDVCGIGYRLEKKLQRLGVSTPYQIRFFSQEELLPLFGPFWSAELHNIAYGEESHVLKLIDRELPHMKSVGRSITGYKLYTDQHDIKRILLNLMEETTYKVRKMKLAGRYVWIKLYGHEQHWQAHRTLSHYVRHTSELFDILYNQLYLRDKPDFPVIKFAVRLGLLKPLIETPQPLFQSWHQREAAYQAMDAISDRYGLFTLRSGALLNQPVIKPEVTGFLGDRTYYGL